MVSGRRSGLSIALAAAGTALVIGMVAIATDALSGGGDRDAVESVEPGVAVAADESLLADPGTPLGNGFVVAAGSRLVGGVFPIVNKPYVETGVRHVPSGWAAQLIVDGAPLAVFDAYVAQARQAGYPVWGGCQAATGEQWISLEDAAQVTADVVRCDAEYYRVADDRSSMLRVAIQLLVGEYRGTPASHVGIRYYVEGNGSGSDKRFRAGPTLAAVRAAMPKLEAVRPHQLADAAEPIAPGLSDRIRLRVPPASRVVATPSYGLSCTSGYEAVLASEDVDAAMADLRSQLGVVSDAPLKGNAKTVGGNRVAVAETDATGDTRAVVTSMSRGKRGLILVSAC